MKPRRRFLFIPLLAVLASGILAGGAHGASRDAAGELRRERVRLIEMKEKEEKIAAELAEALRQEKRSKGRVGELQARLERQRRILSRIDRRIALLNDRLERTEKAVRELEEEHGQAKNALRRTVRAGFFGTLAGGAGPPWEPSAGERSRYYLRMYLGVGAEEFSRIDQARNRKEAELSGIERQVAVTERKMAIEKKVGDTLRARQEEERRRLEDIEKERKRKGAELAKLRARIARMEAVVSRVERQVREREQRARKKGGGAARGVGAGGAPKEEAEKPLRFASIAGGLSAPLRGKPLSRFGRQHDPTFDVTIENRGVEIEAASGAAVQAVAQGEVAFAGGVSGYGNVLIVQHGGGLFSVYGKLQSFLVRQGDSVRRGDPIGRLPESPTGKSVLYLELRAGGTAIDPMSAIPFDR